MNTPLVNKPKTTQVVPTTLSSSPSASTSSSTSPPSSSSPFPFPTNIKPVVSAWSSDSTPAWLKQHQQSIQSSSVFPSPSISAPLLSSTPSPPPVIDEIFRLFTSNRYTSPVDCLSELEEMSIKCSTSALSSRSPYMHNSLLHVALASGHSSSVQYLLNKGLDPYATNDDGDSIVLYSLKQKCHSAIIDLIHWNVVNQSKNNVEDGEEEGSCKESSPSPHNTISLKRLFSSVNTLDGINPLHLSCSLGINELVDLILLLSLNPINSTDKHGKSPLFYAVEHNHLTTVQLLLSRTPFIRYSLRDSSNNSIFHSLARYGHCPMLHLLIRETMDFPLLFSVNSDNETPLSISVDCGMGEFSESIRTQYTTKGKQRWMKFKYLYFGKFAGYFVLFWIFLWLIHHSIIILPIIHLLPLSYSFHGFMYFLLATSVGSWICTHCTQPGVLPQEIDSHGNIVGVVNRSSPLPSSSYNLTKDKENQTDEESHLLKEISVDGIDTSDQSHNESRRNYLCSSLLKTNYYNLLINKGSYNEMHACSPASLSVSSSSTPPTTNICYTCRVVRPPRSKHCAQLNRCISLYDHYW